MEDKIKELISKLTDQIGKFLIACKAEGDVTIDDVLKRLEELKKKTSLLLDISPYKYLLHFLPVRLYCVTCPH